MGRFREKLYRFMYGRYGADDLYKFLMVLFWILWLAEIIAVMVIPQGIAKAIVQAVFGALLVALMVWTTFRMMSRNIYKRRRENELYLKARGTARRFFGGNTSKKTRSGNRDDYAYIFRDCTKCNCTLRLPRRSGKHSVKCPRCSHSFFVKSK
jgi:hypothetical protein